MSLRAEAHRPSPEGRVLELEIPSDVACIERVVEAVRHECLQVQFSERLVALNVRVALTEALSNAILRGNRGRDDAVVRVRAQVDAAMLLLEVADEGAGFDLDACAVDPTTPDRLDAEDGRGLFLMRRLMHRVERLDVHGRSVIRMTLYRE